MNRRNFFQKLLPKNWRTGNYSVFLQTTDEENKIIEDAKLELYDFNISFELLKEFDEESINNVLTKLSELSYDECLIKWGRSGYMIIQWSVYCIDIRSACNAIKMLIEDVQNNIEDVKLNAINVEIE